MERVTALTKAAYGCLDTFRENNKTKNTNNAHSLRKTAAPT